MVELLAMPLEVIADLLARHDLHIPCLLDADVGIEALIGHSCLDDLALMLNLHLNGRFVQAVEVRRPGFNDFIGGPEAEACSRPHHFY